jgi:hypothetical protein
MPKQFISATLISIITFSSIPSHSADFETDVFGSKMTVGIVDGNATKQRLTVGESVDLTGDWLEINRIDAISGTGYIVGKIGEATNFVQPPPFIIEIEKGKVPKVHGPIATDTNIKVRYYSDGVRFEEPGYPNDIVRIWTWMPHKSLVESTKLVRFDPSLSWDSLLTSTPSHPKEILFNSEVVESIKTVVSSQYDSYLGFFYGLGSVSNSNGLIVMDTCPRQQCDLIGSLTVLDPSSRSVFIAMKNEGQDIEVIPAVRDWSSDAKKSLSAWSGSFKK